MTRLLIFFLAFCDSASLIVFVHSSIYTLFCLQCVCACVRCITSIYLSFSIFIYQSIYPFIYLYLFSFFLYLLILQSISMCLYLFTFSIRSIQLFICQYIFYSSLYLPFVNLLSIYPSNKTILYLLFISVDCPPIYLTKFQYTYCLYLSTVYI